MKDRPYLRYDGTEPVQQYSGAQAAEMEAVKNIHAAMIRCDAAREALAAAQEALRRALRKSKIPRQTRADFEKFWASGGTTAAEYKEWYYGGYKRPPAPVRQKKHMRLIVNKAAPIVRQSLPRERLYDDDDGPEAA